MTAVREGNPPEAWDAFFESHALDETLDGRVTHVVPFGAFVDVEGVTGLMLAREAAGPLEVGQQVRVRMQRISAARRQVKFAPA
ncbi:MAG TPA: S1 RNA-binding domain-containing protein [Streptosporangiaceae bacterium]